MSIVVPQSMLNGLSFEKAKHYGMPHLGSHYTGSGSRHYKLDDNARCSFCMRPATNSHHEPPLSNGDEFELHGVSLRPALIAFCGNGTRGCHGRRHAGKIRIEWKWFSDLFEAMWWDGTFLKAGIKSNDPVLFRYGEWVITNE